MPMRLLLPRRCCRTGNRSPLHSGQTILVATKLGNKQAKRERLERIAAVIGQHPSGISQSELARRMNMPRSTVNRDLFALEKAGILLAQDRRGRLALFGRRR